MWRRISVVHRVLRSALSGRPPAPEPGLPRAKDCYPVPTGPVSTPAEAWGAGHAPARRCARVPHCQVMRRAGARRAASRGARGSSTAGKCDNGRARPLGRAEFSRGPRHGFMPSASVSGPPRQRLYRDEAIWAPSRTGGPASRSHRRCGRAAPGRQGKPPRARCSRVAGTRASGRGRYDACCTALGVSHARVRAQCRRLMRMRCSGPARAGQAISASAEPAAPARPPPVRRSARCEALPPRPRGHASHTRGPRWSRYSSHPSPRSASCAACR